MVKPLYIIVHEDKVRDSVECNATASSALAEIERIKKKYKKCEFRSF